MGRHSLNENASDTAVSAAFGMASLSEVEAILLTALVAAALALWGVITQRVVSRRSATLDYLWEIDS